MCDPISLTIAATAAATIGTGYSALQSAAQSRYQGQVADQNAKLANEAARREEENTRDAALQHYRRVGALKGQQRVAMAAGGLDVNFGNAAELTADTDMLANEDVRRIYDQGAENVLGRNIESNNYRSQAKASRQAATGALVKGVFDVGSTALGGAKQYDALKRKGY